MSDVALQASGLVKRIEGEIEKSGAKLGYRDTYRLRAPISNDGGLTVPSGRFTTERESS